MQFEIIEQTKEYFAEQLKNGVLFLKEDYIDQVPKSWFDAVQFIMFYGIGQQNNEFILVLNEEQTIQLNDALTKNIIQLQILSERKKDGHKISWQMGLMKIPNNGPEKEPEALFLGGEMMRNYCDLNNIFYNTFLSEDGALLSCSNMRFLKDNHENCRNPKNKLEMLEKFLNDKSLCNCPWHEDKNTSCHYNTATDEYYCYSCGKKGTGLELARGLLRK